MAGHLGRWGIEPLQLLAEGAALGPVFELRLWRRTIVGYGADWNRLVLRDLDTFRSKGSLSRLTPYLNGGVVLTDVPLHAPRRRELNPHLHSQALDHVQARLVDVVGEAAPHGVLDANEWASTTVRRMLNAAFFGGRVDDRLLTAFFRPLDRPVPYPFLPRPLLFRRMGAAIDTCLRDPVEGTIAGALVEVDGAAEELRIALAAAYDTTAHTLAWAIWHLAGSPEWRDPTTLSAAIDETLRLYPAGWIGSRISSRAFDVGSVSIPARTLVLYSPYLSHRDPRVWPDPDSFRPERFAERLPAWAYIPFSAGERTCLGVHLAKLMLSLSLQSFCGGELRQAGPPPRLVAGLTLRPEGPVLVERG